MEWVTKGFDGFSKGTMGNGGQNLYVSKKGNHRDTRTTAAGML